MSDKGNLESYKLDENKYTIQVCKPCKVTNTIDVDGVLVDMELEIELIDGHPVTTLSFLRRDANWHPGHPETYNRELLEIPKFLGRKTLTDNLELYNYMQDVVERNRDSRDMDEQFPGLRACVLRAIYSLYNKLEELPPYSKEKGYHEELVLVGNRVKAYYNGVEGEWIPFTPDTGFPAVPSSIRRKKREEA